MKTLKCRIMLTLTITTVMFVCVFLFSINLCVASLNYSMNLKVNVLLFSSVLLCRCYKTICTCIIIILIL